MANKAFYEFLLARIYQYRGGYDTGPHRSLQSERCPENQKTELSPAGLFLVQHKHSRLL